MISKTLADKQYTQDSIKVMQNATASKSNGPAYLFEKFFSRELLGQHAIIIYGDENVEAILKFLYYWKVLKTIF